MRLLIIATLLMSNAYAFTPVDLTSIEAKDGYGDSVYKILDTVSDNESHCLSMVDIMELDYNANETAKLFCKSKKYN